MAVYDDEKNGGETLTKDKANGGEGNGSNNKPDDTVGKGYTGSNSGSGGNYSGSGALDSTQLGNAESNDVNNKSDDSVGKGYTASNSKKDSKTSKFAANVKNLAGNKKVLAGGGVGAGIVTVVIFGIISSGALKIEHIVENLQDRFGATTQNAIGNETQALFTGYLKKILPQYRSCGTTIKRDCNIKIVGSDPVSNLYKSWRNARIENTLASKYGIEVSYDTASRTYYLKSPGANDTAQGDAIGTHDDANNTDDFSSLDNVMSNRTEVRQTVNTAIKQETLWKQVLYRYKIGRYLEEKYAIKRCIIACGSVRDPLANFANEKKNAMQIYLVQRVITPRTQTLGLVFECLLSDSCDASTEKSTDTASAPCQDDCELNGADETPESGLIRTTLADSAADFGITDETTIKSMVDEYNKISEQGYSNYAITAILEKVGLSDLSTQATDVVPVVGWIKTAAQLISTLGSAGPKLVGLSYLTNSSASVHLFEMYVTYADEAKTGKADSTEYGSFVNALAPGDHGNTVNPSASDKEIGGTSGAEGAPLYQEIVDGDSGPPNNTLSAAPSLLSDAFSTQAFASSSDSGTSNTQKTPYLCNNNEPPPEGKKVCPEEVLGGGNAVLSAISSNLNTPPLSLLLNVANEIEHTVGLAFNLFGSLLSWLLARLPGYKSFADFIGGIVQPAETFIASKLVPDPFGTNMSGGRTFDLMAAGADVSNNDYAHNGLGGVALTPQQTNTIVSEQTNENKKEFQSQPLFARLFSTSSPYSLISRFADAIPIGTSADVSSIASIFTSPFATIGHSFSTIIDSRVNAAGTAQPDPFGVTQYGYPTGSIPSDPESYWNQNCTAGLNTSEANPDVAQDQMTTTYNSIAAQNVDSNNEQPVNPQTSAPGAGTDPCLLIQAAVGSAGAVYDENLLTPADLSDINGNGSTTTTGSTASNANIYWVGDSLTVGMSGEGNLQADLTAKGYTVNKIEATTGDSVAAALPKVQADASSVSNAGTVVVELGTNNCSLSDAPTCETTPEFEGQITSMMTAIKAEDPNAQVYWVNIYTTKGPVYQSINQAIAAEASTYNYKVIDWASEATTNPSKYSFDSSLGVHQTTGTGYQNMATFVTSQISSAPSATADSGTNAVAQALLGNQKKEPSLISNVAGIFSKLVSTVSTYDKKTDWTY